MHRLRFASVALALLAACSESSARQAPAAATPPSGSAPSAAAPSPNPAAAARVTEWRYNPTADVKVSGADPLTVETGPHVILWPANAQPLAPPYTIRARLQKHTGRTHEGIGILFGGSGLDGPETSQRYAYFLTRGDGSFLVKIRRGAELPIVQDWTTHPAIRRDGEDGGRPNDLEVRATAADVAFLVNGTEVARLPASKFELKGIAGLRVSHELQLEVTGFQAVPGTPAGAVQR
jgi:hypothetical protein